MVENGAPLCYKPCLQIVGSPFDANVDVDVGRDGLESYETSTVKFPGKHQWGILYRARHRWPIRVISGDVPLPIRSKSQFDPSAPPQAPVTKAILFVTVLLFVGSLMKIRKYLEKKRNFFKALPNGVDTSICTASREVPFICCPAEP